MKRKTSARPALLTLAVLLGLARPAAAWDREFGQVVHHVHATYHGHRQNRVLFWFVGAVLTFWHPYGVKSLKIAMFEDLDFNPNLNDERMNALMSKSLRHGWQPLVRVWSRRDGERTYIFARDHGKDLEVFIVSLERDEAVVLKTRFDPERLDDDLLKDEDDDLGRRLNRKLNRGEEIASASGDAVPQALPPTVWLSARARTSEAAMNY